MLPGLLYWPRKERLPINAFVYSWRSRLSRSMLTHSQLGVSAFFSRDDNRSGRGDNAAQRPDSATTWQQSRRRQRKRGLPGPCPASILVHLNRRPQLRDVSQPRRPSGAVVRAWHAHSESRKSRRRAGGRRKPLRRKGGGGERERPSWRGRDQGQSRGRPNRTPSFGRSIFPAAAGRRGHATPTSPASSERPPSRPVLAYTNGFSNYSETSYIPLVEDNTRLVTSGDTPPSFLPRKVSVCEPPGENLECEVDFTSERNLSGRSRICLRAESMLTSPYPTPPPPRKKIRRTDGLSDRATGRETGSCITVNPQNKRKTDRQIRRTDRGVLQG